MGENAESNKRVWLITGATLGRGDEELGQALMKSFLSTLAEKAHPGTIYFINAGVLLTAGTEALTEYLQTLEEEGWLLASCGTCLDWFRLQDQVVAGSVTNMQTIVQGIEEAEKVVTL